MITFADFSQFHFLRPEWLLLIPIACLASLALWRFGKLSENAWQQSIDPNLLSHLLVKSTQQSSPLWLIPLVLGFIIASLALAGPTWQKTPQPIEKNQDALVILVDLSLSMLSDDIKPNRLERTKLKLQDLLEQRNEGLTGLVAYAGDAHKVIPLTDDTRTITAILPALSPKIMPVPGSNLPAGILAATELLKDSNAHTGRILVVTDGIANNQIDLVAEQLEGYTLSILGVGTEQGAPIPLSSGYLKDKSGAIVIPKLNWRELEAAAQSTQARLARLEFTDIDIKQLLPNTHTNTSTSIQEERDFDQWQEQGPWLILLLLPIAALSFRRGWLLSLTLVSSLSFFSTPHAAYALSWDDLWSTKNQQGAKALETQDAEAAAKLFEDTQWKGSAAYKAGDYEQAINAFSGIPEPERTPSNHYNLGNALAKAGQLEAALDAYNHVLETQPEHTDAQHNKALIEELLKQQNEEQKQEQEQQDSENSEQNEDNKSSDNNQQQSNQDSDESQSSESDENSESQSQQNQDTENNQQETNEQDKNAQESEASEQTQQDHEAMKDALQQDMQENDSQEEQEQEAQQAPSQVQASPAPNPPQEAAQAMETNEPLSEEQQALEQWLRRIPDDPGGLLRRKFHHKYQQQRQAVQAQPKEDYPLW